MGDRTTGHLIEQRVSRRETPILMDLSGDPARTLSRDEADECTGSKRLTTSLIKRGLLVENGDKRLKLSPRGYDFGWMLRMRETKKERARNDLADVVFDYDEASGGAKVRVTARTKFGRLLVFMHEATNKNSTIPAEGAADVARHMRNDGGVVINRANRKFDPKIHGRRKEEA